MGRFMASALSRLFKEHESIITAARQVVASAAEGRVAIGRLQSWQRAGKCDPEKYMWRVEFTSRTHYEDFVRAMDDLVGAASEV